MPLVAHSGLPTFERLRQEGYEVLSTERARRQDIRELHIGLLNMMPDAALRATERQFLRLVGACNRIVQICIHPFTIAPQGRGPEARAYLDEFYEDFQDLQEAGLDALILTGANPASEDITQEDFWHPMIEVVDWARENVCSILCSCWATHAMLRQYSGVERTRRHRKRWGVYSHRVVAPDHPLVRHVNTRFDVPRSHLYEVSAAQVERAGGRVLAASEEAGFHLATSADGFRFVYFQGHPEYDVDSLLKEYKREVQRFASGQISEYPPYPESYFPAPAVEILEAHERAVRAALERSHISLSGQPGSGQPGSGQPGSGQPGSGQPGSGPAFPEAAILPHLDNTWTDTGKAMFNNWLGLVYQLTHRERRQPFMDGKEARDLSF